MNKTATPSRRPSSKPNARPALDTVALDAMGVIFEASDDVAELLVPFVRQSGSVQDSAAVEAAYRRCSLGEIQPHELWESLGVSVPGADPSEVYLRAHRLTPGLLRFLAEMRSRGIEVSCLSNDVADWSRQLRRTFGLAQQIAHWTVSGDVGARKPDPRIYRRFLADTGFEASRCLLVDDREANLDAARALGFQTIRFGSASTATSHQLCRTFEEVARCL